VHVDVPSSGTIGVGLRAASPATLRVVDGAGSAQIAVDRAFALGVGSVTRFATVQASAGVLRLVARVGVDDDFETIELGVRDSNGRPLRGRVPSGGERVSAKVWRVSPMLLPASTNPPGGASPASGGSTTPKDATGRFVAALGALAARESRTAEGLLH